MKLSDNNIQERCRGSSASKGIRKVISRHVRHGRAVAEDYSLVIVREKNPLVTLLRNKVFNFAKVASEVLSTECD